jgi:hypothetical protein
MNTFFLKIVPDVKGTLMHDILELQRRLMEAVHPQIETERRAIEAMNAPMELQRRSEEATNPYAELQRRATEAMYPQIEVECRAIEAVAAAYAPIPLDPRCAPIPLDARYAPIQADPLSAHKITDLIGQDPRLVASATNPLGCELQAAEIIELELAKRMADPVGTHLGLERIADPLSVHKITDLIGHDPRLVASAINPIRCELQAAEIIELELAKRMADPVGTHLGLERIADPLGTYLGLADLREPGEDHVGFTMPPQMPNIAFTHEETLREVRELRVRWRN